MSQLNSMRTFLDLAREVGWTDGGSVALAAATSATLAAGVAAATQLDLNGVAEPSVMAGLVQPSSGARKVTLTVTDGDVSINAFDITIVGTDETGAAATENFLFAGGLVQTTTKYYKTVTSITLNSIAGNAAGDTLDAAYSTALRLTLPVQPTGQRRLRLTFTDANASINAFSVTVIGTDRFGAAVSETFVFAGGLIQTTAAYLATLTSITLASITGGAVADTLAADWTTSLALFIPVLDGDYSVGLEDPLREQPHVVGDQDSQFMVQDVRNLAGDLKVGAWPHLMKDLLDFASARTAGELGSATCRYTFPNVETRVHKGLKCDRLQVAGQNAGDIMFTLGLVGAWEDTTGALSYPGAYEVPAIPSLLFKNCRFIISLDAGSAFANRISPVGLESFEITLNNNLKRGPSLEERIDVIKDGRVEFLVPGRRKVDLRYTAAFDRLAYSTLQRSRLRTQFKMLAAHPSYGYATVGVGGGAAGSAVNILVDSSAGFAIGDIVFFDNYGTTNLPCVGTVSDVPDGTHVTIDVLDENVAQGDHVFHGAVEIKTAPCLVQNSTPDKPFDDFVKVTVNAQAFSGGADPFTYKARDIALP